MSPCTNRLDADDAESPECGDEGRMCEPCFQKEANYWRKYFGQDYGTREEKRERLRAMDPRNDRAKAEGGAV